MRIYKNLHVVAFVAAMMALGAQAMPVTDSASVLRAVTAWSAANGGAFANPGKANDATPVYDDDGTTILYWIVTMSNGGAVIASPDTDLDLVVSVLEKYDGPLPKGHPLPDILKNDMRNRLDVLAKRAEASLPRLNAPAGSAAQATFKTSEALEASIVGANGQWAKYGIGNAIPQLRGATLTGDDSSPFVRRIVDGFESKGRFTHWNQSQGIYNYHTPNGEVCGCVATAGAAIMQFFGCTTDPGIVTSVRPDGCSLYGHAHDCTTIAGEYDWSTIPEYGGDFVSWSSGLTEENREMLGRATYNMGVLVGMMWASKGPGSDSGAYVSFLSKALKAAGFKTARYVEYSGATDSDGKEFFKTLYAQMWCGAPVVLGIQGTPGGHAVIGCGYARDADGDEFCRVFMGWSGSGDSWYRFPSVQDFNVLDEAVTMIGYEDDAVVPVYGETNVPGAEFFLPGYAFEDGSIAKVTVNERGYFGIRVPYGLADKTVFYPERGKSADIAPFDATALADESKTRAELDKAIPNELYFPVLDMTMKQTVESGRAVAERDGKALLLISGTSDSARSKLLTDYLYHLDATSDLSNRFVYVYASRSSSNPNEPDGDPSIGVFDPVDFNPDERWKDSNAKLQYETFIDYEASGETNTLGIATNVVIYTYTTNDTAAVTNCLDTILPAGYDMYLRRRSGISVTVRGVIFCAWHVHERERRRCIFMFGVDY